MAAARVAKANHGGPKGAFDGWNHLINLVEFEGRRYLVDFGFGANGELFRY
jgi:arylamine N-acetyltransferase